MFTRIYKDSNKIPFVDMNDIEKFKSLINENTKLVWVETPTDPLMKLADIQEIAAITKKKKFFCSRQYFCNALFAETIRSRS
jgi:cystathionine beta-lyase